MSMSQPISNVREQHRSEAFDVVIWIIAVKQVCLHFFEKGVADVLADVTGCIFFFLMININVEQASAIDLLEISINNLFGVVVAVI